MALSVVIQDLVAVAVSLYVVVVLTGLAAWIVCGAQQPQLFTPSALPTTLRHCVTSTEWCSGLLMTTGTGEEPPPQLLLRMGLNVIHFAPFAITHVVMASRGFKELLRQLRYPDRLERTTYCLVAAATIHWFMSAFWATPMRIYNDDNDRGAASSGLQGGSTPAWLGLIDAVCLVGAGALLWSSLGIHPKGVLGFLGVINDRGDRGTVSRCPLAASARRPPQGAALCDAGVYGWVRHPMMTGLLLLLWGSVARMTPDRIAVATFCTLFVCVVVPTWEEPRLASEFGTTYQQYRKRVKSAFLPGLW